MILKFPDLNTLRLALLTGAVPPGVGQAPARAGFDDRGQLWLDTGAALPRAAQNGLKKFGVQVGRTAEADLTLHVTCWPELLPLQPDTAALERPDQTPVLFDLAGGEQLARLVLEILRLGNDRQGYRWLDGTDAEDGRALLRVVGPPYYSLLRALDRRGREAAPRAFVERAPRVWVEVGFTHPLAKHLKPAAGKLLLIHAPRQWTLLDDAPFRDIYEVLEFPLPDAPPRWRDGDLGGTIKVPLTLRPGGPPDGAEFWVLGEEAIAGLNGFVQDADERLLGRLAFAVGDRDGRRTVVLRLRPSKLPPPVLVLPARGYRSYQKLPNLFVPAGTRLHPPLRRDVLRKLFAEDLGVVTWLRPDEGGAFAPQQLPEDAFRPLSDWVEYVLDRDREALQAWTQALTFDFEPFVCAEDAPAKPRKSAAEKSRGVKKPGEGGDAEAPELPKFAFVDKSRKPEEQAEARDASDELPKAEPDVLERRRRALEERFLTAEGGLDAPERRALWPQLARLNGELNDLEEASACWVNALWSRERPTTGWAWSWLCAEAPSVPARPAAGLPRGRAWVAGVTAGGEVRGDDLDRLLALAEPAAADVRALAAYLVWAAERTPPSGALPERLGAVQRFLETHERLLPVRAAWLAWTQVTRLAHGDVLALARARDRILERLFRDGFVPEQNLPSFLRCAGRPGGTRLRGGREWLLKLAEEARAWTNRGENRPLDGSPQTRAYVDLMFSYALARVGEHDAGRELLRRAKGALAEGGEAHVFLFNAFEYRIRQALDGRGARGPLPLEQTEYLEKMERMPRYVVDRLRERSRILEPDTKINPYRHWAWRASDLDVALAELVDLTDRGEIAERVHRLLRDTPKRASAERQARVLRTALELAPLVGEEFAGEMLGRAAAVYDALPPPPDLATLLDRAKLLEKALFVAAHFDRGEHVQALVGRFELMLQARQGDQAVECLDALAGQCLRGLRKLGMRDEIDRLLGRMADLILAGRDVQSLDARRVPNWPKALRALLHVAGGWYYFGRDGQAEPVMQAARALLFRKELLVRDKAPLAAAYAATLGQAPAEPARQRLEELFGRLDGVRDTFTTAPYYTVTQLEVVEAVVLAAASDEFTLGSQARRWLDDDEFLVRRRIHQDVKALLART